MSTTPTPAEALHNLYSLTCAVHGVLALAGLDEEARGDDAQNLAYLLRIFVQILDDNWVVLSNAFPPHDPCGEGEAL